MRLDAAFAVDGGRAVKDLRHPFTQDPAEHAGICACGDVDFVHLPQTLGYRWKRFVSWATYSDASAWTAFGLVATLGAGFLFWVALSVSRPLCVTPSGTPTACTYGHRFGKHHHPRHHVALVGPARHNGVPVQP